MLADGECSDHEIILLHICADLLHGAEVGGVAVDGAASGHLQTLQVTVGEHVEQGCLASTGRAHDCQELPGVHNALDCGSSAPDS